MGDETTGRLWLIDAGYLLKCQNTYKKGYQFSYMKLRQRLEKDGSLWRAYYLNSTPNPPSDQQDGFHSWLRTGPPKGPKIITKLYKLRQVKANEPYCETCLKKITVKCPAGSEHKLHKQQQKGVDVGIATLALVHSDKYDTLVLSSGDGDLLDAVEYLSEKGKRIELLVFRYGVSSDLQSRADHIYWTTISRRMSCRTKRSHRPLSFRSRFQTKPTMRFRRRPLLPNMPMEPSRDDLSVARGSFATLGSSPIDGPWIKC